MLGEAFRAYFLLAFLLFYGGSPGIEKVKKQDAQRRPWYGKGLRFECQRCGNCCRGEPGDVWVTTKEIGSISSYMKESPDGFARKYLRKVGRRTSLLEFQNGDCIMYSNGCRVYKARPKQCRTFPFWSSNLKGRNTWEELKEFCPGVDRGRLHTMHEIEQQRLGE